MWENTDQKTPNTSTFHAVSVLLNILNVLSENGIILYELAYFLRSTNNVNFTEMYFLKARLRAHA